MDITTKGRSFFNLICREHQSVVGSKLCVQRGFTLLGSVVNSHDVPTDNATVQQRRIEHDELSNGSCTISGTSFGVSSLASTRD